MNLFLVAVILAVHVANCAIDADAVASDNGQAQLRQSLSQAAQGDNITDLGIIAKFITDYVGKEVGNVRKEVGNVRKEVGNVRKEVGNVRKEVGNVRKEVGNVRKEVGNVRKEVGKEVGNVRKEVAKADTKLDKRITLEIGNVKKGQLHCLTGYHTYVPTKSDQTEKLPVKFSRSFANTPVVMTSVYRAWNGCHDYDAPEFIVYPTGVNRGGFTLFSDVAFKGTCGIGVKVGIMYMACGKF